LYSDVASDDDDDVDDDNFWIICRDTS